MSRIGSTTKTDSFEPPRASREKWKTELAGAVRNGEELVDLLGLPHLMREDARRASLEFPVVVPRSYLARMEFGNPRDPLLLQVLPTLQETESRSNFKADAVGDLPSREAPGLLRKYHGRGLLITTGVCAVHCRYCFRRHYPYADEPGSLDQWEPAFEAIRRDLSLHEILLSGGDPLILSDERLSALLSKLEEIPHLRRLRLHSRLPIVLPSRVTPGLIHLLNESRLTVFMVVHANHPHELQGDCADALRSLVKSGITVLNQAVLLRDINDDIETQIALCEGLIDLGVLPYYLHQLDRVTGTAHFEVERERGIAILSEMRKRLPGFAVPRYVEEIAGGESKLPVVA